MPKRRIRSCVIRFPEAWPAMPEVFRSVITEHAAWRITGHHLSRAFSLPDGGQWLVTVGKAAPSYRAFTSSTGKHPRLDVFALPEDGLSEIPELSCALTRLSAVARFRTSDLWDAIGTAVIRQVVRASQAKQLYQRFCEVYGPRISGAGAGHALFPPAETVAGLHDEHFAAVGLSFKRTPLREAAAAYLEHRPRWPGLPPGELVRELQQVRRIGPWTAGAAVADFTNDFTCYPYADLAVRTWAKRAAPSYPWPDDEQDFARLWRGLAGDQLANVTLLTLAWGNYYAAAS
jgi:DNA-3-methyladenine glycosylase II